jgi:hypothetical protein
MRQGTRILRQTELDRGSIASGQGQEIEVPTGQAIPHTLATLQLQKYQDTSLQSSVE